MRSTLAALLVLASCQSSRVSSKLGAECSLNTDCAQKCLDGPSWPNGFCTTICDTDSQCPSGARCISEDGGVCAFECTESSDCSFLDTLYMCETVDAMSGQVMVCRGGG
ncbi:MAG TPA: hypothetical protein VMJ10_16970 [Kofleriaceae bacterium]|nr:hypothetical protein [Kofleriaceae bacterium]